MAALPITLLDEVAQDFRATIDTSCSPALARVSVVRASGRQQEFLLQLWANGSVVSVHEALPNQLPLFCPDRHINGDRSFCLGWGGGSPSNVLDQAGARQWWSAVVRFLSRQITANETRRWVNGPYDWAHGDAAQHQARAEAAADALGPRFRSDFDHGAFQVIREPHARGTRIALMRNGVFEARIVLGPPVRLKDGDVPRPCGSIDGRALVQSEERIGYLTTFVAELWHWRDREARFSRELALSGSVCCNTLDRCALRDAISEVASQKKSKELHARRHLPRRRPRL